MDHGTNAPTLHNVGIEHLRTDEVFQIAIAAPPSEKLVSFIESKKKFCNFESISKDDFQRRKYDLKRRKGKPTSYTSHYHDRE